MPIGSAKARIERPFRRTHSPCTVGAEHALGAVAEVARMLLGLEADQVVGAEIGDQLARHRHRLHHRRRRERDVQEEAERPVEALLAQHAAERDQVIVVRPQRVVGLQHGAERCGEGRG